MLKENWIWMPHPAHFILANRCEFRLTTYVGGHIVSTVGEFMPDEGPREIHAQVRGIKLEGRGDAREYDFRLKCGFVEVGLDRKYETMVFKAIPNPHHKCCPWTVDGLRNVDFRGYNDPDAATEGHNELCAEYGGRDVD